jgi:hypothetical protein
LNTNNTATANKALAIPVSRRTFGMSNLKLEEVKKLTGKL